eukprot:1074430-Alexandrium_andersonii.AAC.1
MASGVSLCSLIRSNQPMASSTCPDFAQALIMRPKVPMLGVAPTESILSNHGRTETGVAGDDFASCGRY